jgi:hypothetical protein
MVGDLGRWVLARRRATSTRSVLAVSGPAPRVNERTKQRLGFCVPNRRQLMRVEGWEGGGVAGGRYHPSVTAMAAVSGSPRTPM